MGSADMPRTETQTELFRKRRNALDPFETEDFPESSKKLAAEVLVPRGNTNKFAAYSHCQAKPQTTTKYKIASQQRKGLVRKVVHGVWKCLKHKKGTKKC